MSDVLKLGARIGCLTLLLTQAALAQTWTNRIGNQTCSPAEFCTPNTLEELCQAVTQANAKHLKIHAIGNGFSPSEIGCCDGVLLHLGHLSRVLSVHLSTGRVRVEAGISLCDLHETLAYYGLALPNQPAMDLISLGGALSTGVHGTGHTGTLSQFVEEIELLTADGRLLRLSPKDGDLFAAANVGLGALGILYAVTLQCEPSFKVHAATSLMDIETILAQYPTLHASNDFFQLVWNATTGACVVQTWNRADCSETHDPAAVPAYQALRYYTFDPNDHDLFSEIAVPVEQLPETIKAIQGLAQKHRAQGATVCDICVRFVDADPKSLLSPSAGRAVAYFTYSLSNQETYLTCYREFEEVLTSLGGRPHWGKTNFMNHQKATAVYGENLTRFLQVKSLLDPHGRFSTPYLDRVLSASCEMASSAEFIK